MSTKFGAIRSQPDLIPFPINALLNMTFKQQRNMRFEGAAEKQRHKACAEILSVTRTRTETVDIYIQLCIAPKETRFYQLIVAEEIVQI